MSLDPYLDKIENLLQKSSNLCTKINTEDIYQCKDFSSPLEILIQSNYIKLQSLSHILINQSITRTKRSLEFGGEILKFFFGTLDADDARKYDAAIENSKKTETELFHLFKDNIHIIKSTINNFNSTISKLNQNEIKLNAQINSMNEIFSQITKNDNIFLYISRINNLLNIIEGSLLSISNLLDTTLNAILFSKLNILHPNVISPFNLFNELSKHSNQINKRLDFPVQLSINNIHSLIDVSKLSSYYYKNKIVFILQIPLITPDKFTVYKNIPLPTPHGESLSHNQTFALIQPSNSYIAISDDRMHYAMLNELNNCKFVNTNYSICELVSIFSSINNPNCESRLLTEVVLSLPSECNAKFLYGQIDIWQTLKNNKWIYVQSKSNKLTIKCNDNIHDYSIVGTGIVKLSDDCIGFYKTIQLLPTTTYTFSVKSPIDINFDITTDDCCKKDIFNKTLPHLTPISLTKINLESLKYQDHQLNNLEVELNNLQSETHFIKYGQYYSAFTYILIVCLFLCIVYKLYKCFRNRSNSHCCVQIFNQCYNKKTQNSKISNSLEMHDISSSEDEKSIRSLPNLNKYGSIQKVICKKTSSSRNINNN